MTVGRAEAADRALMAGACCPCMLHMQLPVKRGTVYIAMGQPERESEKKEWYCLSYLTLDTFPIVIGKKHSKAVGLTS